MIHPVLDWVLFAWTFLGLKEQQASPLLLCSLYHQEEKFQKALGATVPLAQLDHGTPSSQDRLLSKELSAAAVAAMGPETYHKCV